MPTGEEIGRVQGAILRILDGDALDLVGAYYRREATDYPSAKRVLFAGRLFDELPGNRDSLFTVGDLAAASLLDVRFGPHAVLELLERPECNRLLSDIPSDVPLWETREAQLDGNSATGRLWDRLTGIPGVSTTRASKLLARKRPHLMPILDSVVVNALQLRGLNNWLTLRVALTPTVRNRIDALAPAATDQGAALPSTLRLLDVATWMTHSQSRQAKAVRAAQAR